ncbi:MAG TPA: NAD(P)/FAD-dependent oxidoreductase [Actinomycetota bacterium]|nr:NAD(P)/FAD-dependent oxidoreductase [Actinomycetota bacterium]
MRDPYDVIVVGARCAGSPLAMLLARRGYRVLLLDRGHFPSDTVSSHYVQQAATARLERWGLLDAVRASGCPPIYEMDFDIDGIRFRGSAPTDGPREAFSVRRHVLDAILVEAAVEAGAELRDRFTVKDVVWEDGRVVGSRGRRSGGRDVSERARLVVGADGLRSTVAKAVSARVYGERPPLTHQYYTYWSGLPQDALGLYTAPWIGAGVAPTNDGLTIVNIAWSVREFPDVRDDIEGRYLDAMRALPPLADRLDGARREERFSGMPNVPMFFREPASPGWALAGDAGYHKDPVPAQGITDAFRDADAIAETVRRDLEDGDANAWADFARRRDEVALPFYRWTRSVASLEPLAEPARRLLEAVASDRTMSDRYAGLFAETVGPDDFFEFVPPERSGIA